MICPHYTRTSFDQYRCKGATLAGTCGYPENICPVKQQTGAIVQANVDTPISCVPSIANTRKTKKGTRTMSDLIKEHQKFMEDYIKWCEKCNEAAEKQYEEELRQAGEP
jgi:hypothetical protein